MKLLPRLADEDELDRPHEPDQPAAQHPAPLPLPWTLVVAAGAAIPRLLYLFVFSNPQNPGEGIYDDAWHHWQIAYLTKQVGLSAPGGPRLWDLKGLDYVWGLLHPLLLAALFAITGSSDIVIDRLVSLVFGVLCVVLVFHLCRHYWGNGVAIAATLFAIALPTSIVTDASGMQEPIAIGFSLLAIFAWTRRKGFWSGVAFGLAAMSRAEEWAFGAGMVVAAWLRKRDHQQRLPLLAGFVVVMAVYMKILWDKTGNPFYPFWWEFLGVEAGKWGTTTITPGQASVRPLLLLMLAVSLIALALTLWKRPSPYMLLTFGFGYCVFIAGTFGLTSALAEWQWWLPLTRRFYFPLLFAALLVTVVLLRWLPRRFGPRALPAGWVAVGSLLVASQLLWVPIAEAFGPTEGPWQTAMSEGRQLGGWYQQAPYAGHGLAVPPDRADLTYAMVHYAGVDAKHLVSEMYDPFEYLPAGYSYQDHEADVSARVQCWLKANDIRLVAIAQNDANLQLAQQLHPEWFTDVGALPQAGWKVEAVTLPAVCA